MASPMDFASCAALLKTDVLPDGRGSVSFRHRSVKGVTTHIIPCRVYYVSRRIPIKVFLILGRVAHAFGSLYVRCGRAAIPGYLNDENADNNRERPNFRGRLPQSVVPGVRLFARATLQARQVFHRPVPGLRPRLRPKRAV